MIRAAGDEEVSEGNAQTGAVCATFAEQFLKPECNNGREVY
jgi:hypothetical protein